MADHSILAPSAAHRWLHCTASARMEHMTYDKGSDFAAEGSLAHAIAARYLREWNGNTYTAQEIEMTSLMELHTAEMDHYVDTYTQTVAEILLEAQRVDSMAFLSVEVSLPLDKWVPGAHGTADALVVREGRIDIIDLKYGKGVEVSAVENEQLMLYALGALDLYGLDYSVTEVGLTIFQPRLANYSRWTVSVDELNRWAEEVLKPKAAEAYEGQGAAVPGKWCKFCKLRGTCSALATYTEEATAHEARLLTPDELGEALKRLAAIKAWVAEVETTATSQLLAGSTIPGFKLVEGRGRRVIPDQAAAAEVLRSAGLTDDEIFKPRELLGITALEGLMGRKKCQETLGDLVQRQPGSPTLAPEGDKRQAITPGAMFNNFD